MPPIRLSDSELDAVLTAAGPIAVERRDALLQRVADELSCCEIVGPGTVHRVCLEAQREFFDPPDLSSAGRQVGLICRGFDPTNPWYRSRAELSKSKYESDCEQNQPTESKGPNTNEETGGLPRSVNWRNPTFKNS